VSQQSEDGQDQSVNLNRLGGTVRALRRRKRWRQIDLATRANASQQAISRLERGDAGSMSLGRIGRVLSALEADLDLVVRWRGGQLDRLLDARHAVLVGDTARRLEDAGWSILPEVSYSEYGERGSIDLLGWRDEDEVLLVVEVKTELVSVESTLRKHDEKVRLAPVIAGRRLGGRRAWGAARLLVLLDSGAARRQVSEHGDVLDRVYPLRGRAVSDWLRRGAPGERGRSRSSGALVFLPLTQGASGRRIPPSSHRIRVPAGSGEPAQHRPAIAQSGSGRGIGVA
jgi:transcriptional regulator with XRE-family HTH domain